MYKIEFDKLLKSNVPQATFLYGECASLIELYSKKILEAISKSGEVDIFKFYFDSYNANAVRDALSQQSLFSNSSLVIIKLDKIKTPSNKDSGDIASFLKLLEKNPSNYFIFEFYDNGDSAKYNSTARAISAFFNTKQFVFVRFFNPKFNEAMDILKQKSQELHLNISNTSLSYLYSLQNNNLGLCINELNKFVVFDREIVRADIDNLCYGLYSNSIEELCESMLDGKDYFKILENLEDEGVGDTEIVSFMEFYFYRLFLFFAYIKSSGSVNSNAILGYTLPRDIEEKYTKYAMKLKSSQYLEIFRILGEWLIASRSGKSRNNFDNLIKLQAVSKT